MAKQKKQYLIVEHRNSAAYENLRREVDRLRAELIQLTKRFHDLEARFGQEVMINGELVDLLKMNGIRFRETLAYNLRRRMR